jgi:hypothetical protein
MELSFETHIKIVFVGDRRAEIIQSCLGLDVHYGTDYSECWDHSWPDVSFEIPTISPWDERRKSEVGSHPLVIRLRVVDATQLDKRRRRAYRNANLVVLCFSIVDPKTLESMRDKASPAVVSSAVSIAHSL